MSEKVKLMLPLIKGGDTSGMSDKSYHIHDEVTEYINNNRTEEDNKHIEEIMKATRASKVERMKEHVVSYDVKELNEDKVIVLTYKGIASYELSEAMKDQIRETLKLPNDFPVLVQDDSLSIEFRNLKNEQQISNELFELKEAICLLIEEHKKMQKEININTTSLLNSDINVEEIARKLKEMNEKEKRFRPPTL